MASVVAISLLASSACVCSSFFESHEAKRAPRAMVKPSLLTTEVVYFFARILLVRLQVSFARVKVLGKSSYRC